VPDRLADAPDELSVLATQAADWFQSEQGRSVPTAYVIKDFWVTETLRSLAAPLFHEVANQRNSGLTARVVVKGGTSLSKAFGLIDRFSEDIDLYVAAKDAAGRTAKVGKGRAVTLFKTLAERVAADLHLPVTEYADKDKRPDKRAFALAYLQQQAAFPALKH
jgi:predicted nucleotidyltransferase component of viral defense system